MGEGICVIMEKGVWVTLSICTGTGPGQSQEGGEVGGDVPSMVPGNRGDGSESKCSVKET